MKKIPTLFLRDEANPRVVTREPHPECAWVLAGKGTATRKLDGTSCLWKDGRLWKRQEREVPQGSDGSMLIEDAAGYAVAYPNIFGPPWLPAQEHMEHTGHDRWKIPGWLPVGPGPEDRWHREAIFAQLEYGHYRPGDDRVDIFVFRAKDWPGMPVLENYPDLPPLQVHPVEGCTYELIGPKVNGNPEGFSRHLLIEHGGDGLEFSDDVDVQDPSGNDGDPRTYDQIRSFLERIGPMEGLVFHHPDGRMAKIKRRDFGLQWPVKA